MMDDFGNKCYVRRFEFIVYIPPKKNKEINRLFISTV